MIQENKDWIISGSLVLGVFIIVIIGAYFLVTTPTLAEMCQTYPNATFYGIEGNETIECSKWNNVTLQ